MDIRSIVGWCAILSGVVSLGAVAACGSSSGSDGGGGNDAGPSIDATADGSPSTDDGGPVEGGPDAEVSYPAMHSSLPQLTFHGGAIIAHPKIVTVTFEGDTNGAAYAAFDEALGTSTWWQKALLPYGISPAVVAATVVLPDTLAGMTTEFGAFETYLADEISSGALPPADGETIYLVYPSPTALVNFGTSASPIVSCTDFFNVRAHLDVQNPTDAGTPTTVATEFAAIFNCGGSLSLTQFAASAAVANAATNPQTNGTGYVLDTDHAWGAVFNGGYGPNAPASAAADLCFDVPWWTEGAYSFSRVYSNAAAASSENPCQPDTGVYFGAAPDTMTVATGDPADGGTVDNGVIEVTAGSSTTVAVRFFSQGPLPSDATVAVGDTIEQSNHLYPLTQFGGLTNGLSATLSQTTMHNGDVTMLTVTASASAVVGSTHPFVIRSTVAPSSVNDWAAEVVVK